MNQRPNSECRSNRGHVVLLGDSIFDNQAYVPGQPCVRDQVQVELGDEWGVTLRAVDGDMTEDVVEQLAEFPKTATHLVISVGGNDAMHRQEILGLPANSAADIFDKLATIREQFATVYATMLERVLQEAVPTAVCTVYHPNYDDPQLQRRAIAGLTIFNDGILRSAVAHGLPVIDLRVLFRERRDYANPIEPSVHGGAKIAREIKVLLRNHDFGAGRTALYAGVEGASTTDA